LIGSLALTAFVVGFKYYDIPALFKSMSGQENLNVLPGTYAPWVGRTMAFAVLSLSELFHSFNMRSEHSLSEIGVFSNWKLVVSFIICSFLQIIVISVPPLAKVFQVVPLSIRQWAIVLLLSFAPIVVVEIQKKLNHPKIQK
jgi:Ca2+-transporting ATPase